ncbi:MAG: thiazole synthase [Pseudomonadota bacterium]
MNANHPSLIHYIYRGFLEVSDLKIGNRIFKSRLFVGTGKFASVSEMIKAIDASGSEFVTVALRRMDFDSNDDEFIDNIDPERILLVPNTSGARDADEACNLARLACAAGAKKWIKLELTPEPRHLLPDPIETLIAAERLVKEGFNVLPYINADPILAKRLEDVGCVAVMPLGSPIGTNKGVEAKEMIKIIIENSNVPVVVDAGLGMPSHAAFAMELGADACLVNTAIATAKDPVKIANAFKLAVECGRDAYLYSKVSTFDTAQASSPRKGFIENLGK